MINDNYYYLYIKYKHDILNHSGLVCLYVWTEVDRQKDLQTKENENLTKKKNVFFILNDLTAQVNFN